MTMSLDGYIAGRDDAMDWVFADHAGQTDRMGDEVLASTGAILAGRRWHDLAAERFHGRRGIYGGRFDGPVLVLSHRPPPADADPAITFVGDLDEGLARGREAAGGRDLVVAVVGGGQGHPPGPGARPRSGHRRVGRARAAADEQVPAEPGPAEQEDPAEHPRAFQQAEEVGNGREGTEHEQRDQLGHHRDAAQHRPDRQRDRLGVHGHRLASPMPSASHST
jgi:hypothetical protein